MNILEIIKKLKSGGKEAELASIHLMPPMDLTDSGLVSLDKDHHEGYKQIKKFLIKNYSFNSNEDYEDIIFNSIAKLFSSIDSLEIRSDAEILGWFWKLVRDVAYDFSSAEQKAQGDKKKSEQLISKISNSKNVDDQISALEKKIAECDRKNIDTLISLQKELDLLVERKNRTIEISESIQESSKNPESDATIIRDCVEKAFNFLSQKYKKSVDVYRAKEIEGKSIPEIIGEYFYDEIEDDKKKLSVIEIFTKNSPFLSAKMNNLYKKVKNYLSESRKRIEPQLKKCWENK